MPVFVVDKPLGPTSHDVVARARKALGTGRVGHAGTLDPLATGVLLILVEEATKLSPWLTGSDKGYLAWVAFGASTPSWDAEGPVDAEADASGLTADRIEAALSPFLDLTEQVPPRHSAIKIGGERAYRAAHRGDTDLAEMEARPAGYRSIDLLAFGPRDSLPTEFASTSAGWREAEGGRTFELPPALAELPTALFAVRVAAGTYLRAFARDLGVALGVPAHLAGLVRTDVGAVDLTESVTVESLPSASGRPMADTLTLPKVSLSGEQVARVRQGQRLPLSELKDVVTTSPQDVALLATDGSLVAIAAVSEEGMSLKRVWPA